MLCAGDTGLIDYCIANWFEKIIDEESGGILRRQICSTTGKMVFWLQIGHSEGPSSDSGAVCPVTLSLGPRGWTWLPSDHARPAELGLGLRLCFAFSWCEANVEHAKKILGESKLNWRVLFEPNPWSSPKPKVLVKKKQGL